MVAGGGLGEFLAGDLTALAGVFEFFVAGRVDLLVAAFETVFGGDEADGGVQPGGVVVFDESAGDPLGVLDVERGERADGLFLEGLMEAFELAVGLGVVGAGHDMAGLPLGDEGFEFPAFELGTLIGVEYLRFAQTKRLLQSI